MNFLRLPLRGDKVVSSANDEDAEISLWKRRSYYHGSG